MGTTVVGVAATMAVAVPGAGAIGADGGVASLGASGIVETFDALADTGSSTILPPGARYDETGTSSAVNGSYTAGTGASNAGDVYSLGSAGASDQALGGLLSGSLTPTLGYAFRNDTGATVTALTVSYTGEQWRLGTTGRQDRLDVGISTTTTDITNAAAFTAVPGLTFTAPISTGTVGARDGNAPANRAVVTTTISGLAVAPAAVVTLRWTDANVAGADDALGVDDLAVSATTGGGGNQPIVADCGGTLSTTAGTAASRAITATDADGRVVTASIVSGAPAGVTLDGVSPAPAPGQPLSATLNVASSVAPGTYSVLLSFTNDDATPQTTECTVPVVVGAPPAITLIHDIQGPGSTSPLAGQTVTIEGVVTGIDDEIGASFGSGNTIVTFPGDAGIYVQEEPADVDADPATSEGIFVGFVRNRADYPPGTRVRLNGLVRDGASPPSFRQTRIDETINQEPVILGTAPLPAPVVIDIAAANSQDPATKPYYESLEGMLVTLPVGVARSGGTNKFGETFLVPGTESDVLQRTDPVEPGLIGTIDHAGSGDPTNPFRPAQSNPLTLPVDQQDTVRNLTGPLGFTFSNYKIAVQTGSLPTIEDTGVAFPYNRLPAVLPGQVRVASFNVENFFPVGGALDGGTVSQAEFDAKLSRLTVAIGDRLRAPDVVAVQEVVDLPTLQALATSLSAAGYGPYRAELVEGNDGRGIDVGYLVKATVPVLGVTQIGLTAPGSCSDVPGRLFDRPPLVLETTLPTPGTPLVVINNHFASKAAPDSCREAQATFVRDQVTTYEAQGKQVIVLGDLNSFEDEVALSVLEGPGTTLSNLFLDTPEPSRYSFQFNGLLQTLDHVLISDGLEQDVTAFDYAHIDNDYFDRETAPEKVSDHDAAVLVLGGPADPVIPESPLVTLFPMLAALVLGGMILARRRSARSFW